MIKNDSKLKQYAASLLVVLSLCISTVAACCCSHHQEKPEIETLSCHAQTSETKSEKHQTVESDKTKQNSELRVPCECSLKSALKAFVKNGNIKIE